MLEISTAPPSYLDYAPRGGPKTGSYEACLNKLGFLPENHNSLPLNKRGKLIQALREHTLEPKCTYLMKEDNEAAFNSLVDGFLHKYGSEFWGPGNRNHLVEKDPSHGFLYPRDAQRKGSR